MATDQLKYTPEALSAMSAQELDVIVAKMKGVSFALEGVTINISRGAGKWPTLFPTAEKAWESMGAYIMTGAHPASDSNAALLLMDEIAGLFPAPVIGCTCTTFKVNLQTVYVAGKPSEAAPRAITTAWILWKQSHTTPNG